MCGDVAGDWLQKLEPTLTTFFKLVSICVLVDKLRAGFGSYKDNRISKLYRKLKFVFSNVDQLIHLREIKLCKGFVKWITLTAPWQPHTWWRYIDDIFMIWTEGSDRLKIFVDYLNNIHPTIKFTSSHSLTNVPFLDVMVSLHNGIIETDLFTKPTDKHQHLLSSSCHPHHTKKAIPFSLALRLRRICCTDAKFKHRINKLKIC